MNIAKILKSVPAGTKLYSPLFAACESLTLWYTQEQPTMYAAQPSPLKLRCRTFSPMEGDTLWPLFDEWGDLIALSVEYSRQEGRALASYFETYTADEHIRWRTSGGGTEEELREDIQLGKIPGVYINRAEPIWEDQSENVYEAEWTLSRNGNYIRKNARPTWVVFSDGNIKWNKEKLGESEARNVLRYGKDDRAEYKTWPQAVDNIRYHVEEIKRGFFQQLQLPDMSMDAMKATPMSGEARKMLFIDAQMKATDESGAWIELLDRELNVLRAFLSTMYPKLAAAFDSLQVEYVITPYQIRDESENISNLTTATGGKPIMSRRTAVNYLGYADDADEELTAIALDEQTAENAADAYEGQQLTAKQTVVAGFERTGEAAKE